MSRLLLIAKNPSLSFGLVGAADEIDEVRPALVNRLEVTPGMADVVVIQQDSPDDALATLDLLRSKGLLAPALLVASGRPEWESFDPAGRPSVAVLDPPVTPERLHHGVGSTAALPVAPPWSDAADLSPTPVESAPAPEVERVLNEPSNPAAVTREPEAQPEVTAEVAATPQVAETLVAEPLAEPAQAKSRKRFGRRKSKSVDEDTSVVTAGAAAATGAELRAEQERQADEQRLEAERAETERLEAERVEAERVETERLEAERLAEEQRLEAERVEAERLEAERLEAERLAEEQRLEAERVEAERLAEEQRLEAERLEAERVEAEQLEAERVEAERLAEEERLETQRLEAERVEAERLAEEQRLEAERIEAERIEAERLAVLPDAPDALEPDEEPYATAVHTDIAADGDDEEIVQAGTPSPADQGSGGLEPVAVVPVAVVAAAPQPTSGVDPPQSAPEMASTAPTHDARFYAEMASLVAAAGEHLESDRDQASPTGEDSGQTSVDGANDDVPRIDVQAVFDPDRRTAVDLMPSTAPSAEPVVPLLPPAPPPLPTPGPRVEVVDLRDTLPEDPRSTPALVRALLARSHEVYGVSEAGALVVSDALARTGATSGALLLPDGPVWRVAAGEGLRRLEHRFVLESDAWLVTTIASRHKGVIIDRTDVARRPLAGAPLAAHKHLVAAPVRPVAGILLIARDEDPAFAERDLLSLSRLAEASASILAAALDARQLARLLGDLRDQDDRAVAERIDYGL